MRFAVVLVAAGASRRLGRPKQLLPYQGTTLVAHAARTALDSGAEPVVAVLGASADLVRSALEGLRVSVVENWEWDSGMGGSIACGVRAVLGSRPLVSSLVLLPADQPLVTGEHVRALAMRREELGVPYVASEFGGELGPPVAFGRELFEDLAALSGDRGARALLARYPERWSIPFPDAAVDIDTVDDAERLDQPLP